MLNLNSIIVTSENPEKLVEFYNKVFGVDKPEWSGGRYFGWQVGSRHFIVCYHDKVKGENKEPGRFMFNFETDDVFGEFERLKGLGAKAVAAPYHPGEEENDMEAMMATLADPDGNYFQLASPMKM